MAYNDRDSDGRTNSSRLALYEKPLPERPLPEAIQPHDAPEVVPHQAPEVFGQAGAQYYVSPVSPGGGRLRGYNDGSVSTGIGAGVGTMPRGFNDGSVSAATGGTNGLTTELDTRMPRVSTTSTMFTSPQRPPFHNAYYAPSSVESDEKYRSPSTTIGPAPSARSLYAARAKQVVRRRPVKWALIIGAVIVLILIIVPTAVTVSKQKAAAAKAANNVTIAFDVNARVRPYTSFTHMKFPEADKLFFQGPDNAIRYGNLTGDEITDVLPISSARNGTSLAASIGNSTEKAEDNAMVLYFIHESKRVSSLYVLGNQTNWTESLLFSQKGHTGDVFAADSYGPAMAFVAAEGVRYNSSLNILDGGGELFMCGDDGKLKQFNDIDGDQWLAFEFPSTFCSWTAVLRRAPYSYLFTRSSPDNNALQLWHRKYTDDYNDPALWQQGPDSPMQVPQENYFCAEGELFAFQAEDGTLQTAKLNWNDNDPSGTTWGNVSMISPKPVPGGSTLVCDSISNDRMQVIYQAQSGAVGWFETNDGGSSWESDRTFGSKCKTKEGPGFCQNSARCNGISYTEALCPNDPDDIQCCVEVPCKVDGGAGLCRSKANNGCAGGTFHAGSGPPFPCPGDEDIQCCIQDTPSSPISPNSPLVT